ncbi:hypothetical protein [Paraburkholderia aromaticivorans]|uniref:hypothetical protein n=1 Tax=Paraburkholderia aromaticivorans TaxID=2026199 RepID=UPI001455DF95|nr:hypothetical protein [Paraburkholderia aromaticivorans]
MGATVTTNKRAGAFKKADGTVVYVLFEESYEKNCYPHTPNWSVTAFGPRKDVLQRIFQHASSCEGGMLRSRAGTIRPETYVETWKQHLAKPQEIFDTEIELSVGESYRSPIPLSAVEEIRILMDSRGFGAQFGQIEASSLQVSLHADVDLLLALYGQSAPLFPWRALGHVHCSRQVLAVEPVRNVKADCMPRVRAYRLDKDDLVVSINGSPLRHAGWDYNAVGNFMDLAYEHELQTPGWGKVAIPWYRELLRQAPRLPDDTHISIQRDPEDGKEHGWRIETLNRLAAAAGVVGAEGEAPMEFSFQFHKLHGDEQRLYDLRSLPREQVLFEVHDEGKVDPVSQAQDAADDWQRDLQLAFELD